ncbi:isocitrate/isopropylmalate family dehydrogenase [Actinosynnema pretiosum]|uniref:isocitrate/isopropylmalate family dehydrogenase n=1 Tax=Actinosynnema pretiosum TaxID=42197 RepID=UPI0031E41999
MVALAGDGVGPEVMAPTLRLLARDSALQVLERPAGYGAWLDTGRTIDEPTLELARTADGVLFGATGTPSPPPESYQSPILLLRRQLRLVANIRHCRRPGGDLDVIMVRDCVEGLYSEVERPIPDGYRADYRITRTITRQLAAAAASIAATRRGVVTVVHKANVLRHSDGLFRATAIEELAKAGVAHEEALSDAAGYHLVADPDRYDVMVMTSHVGDILSDVGAALAGGLGLVPSLTTGDGPPLAEPIHGSAPDIAGTGTADPVAMMLSAALLVERLGHHAFAAALRTAVNAHLDRRAGAPATRWRTVEVYDDVVRRLDSLLAAAEAVAG